MARFKVYRLKNDRSLVIDLQSNLLDNLETRVVAPVVSLHLISKYVARLNPRFEIEGVICVMLTEFIATLPASEIGEQVADLSDKADDIIAATDFLFQGF
ncbi:CcdB family protein [Rhizobium sp. S95]|uniref:Toxin CcdB n=1 Tax=Ciceribacter sichuanensis TaxID=2949647 RepID=A0AAJ1BX35_9HYPH|nr:MULTISPECIES: CcdB family protein [unclassified Ciceribacter]MCM2397029.1 CcdB family protein [Ciceribacter sp. S95]MCO5957879.1 CcdB family protein [Ciceribacter sp. S101]